MVFSIFETDTTESNLFHPSEEIIKKNLETYIKIRLKSVFDTNQCSCDNVYAHVVRIVKRIEAEIRKMIDEIQHTYRCKN